MTCYIINTITTTNFDEMQKYHKLVSIQKYNWTLCPQMHDYWEMIVKIFHEYVNQSTIKNVEDLQKLEDKINIFAGQKGA